MSQLDFSSLNANDSLLVDLGRGIWLMDDHRWALKVWETKRKRDCYTLVHADYHWDACYDFHDNAAEEAELVAATSDDIAELVAKDELIRYDSFIAPAIKRGLISAVHFYCLQDGPGDNALDATFLHACNARQFLHETPQQLATAQIQGPIIFDLCLDLFNRSDQWSTGNLWSDAEILEFIDTICHWIKAAELVTVSMSFGYSGDVADTRYLTNLVIPRILELRSES